MVKGSCVCGDLTYEFTGEPGGWAACHCVPCRKTSGTGASWNLLIPEDNFAVKSGKANKSFTREADSGSGPVTYNVCAKCANLIWVEAAGFAGLKLVKAGTVDDTDFMNNIGLPKLEIYCKNMTPWETKIPGATHADVAP